MPSDRLRWGKTLRPADESPETPVGTAADVGTKTGTTRRASAKSGSKAGLARADRDMGSALRSIYQRTIDEDIPDEMLSLLGKLD